MQFMIGACHLWSETSSQMDEFMDEFMEAMKEVFPQLLVQFEDFSTDNAFRYLERFRNTYRCFNDDVRRIFRLVFCVCGFLTTASLFLLFCFCLKQIQGTG